MPQGTIKKIVSDRGFGFISGEQGERFFHQSSVVETSFDNLREGQVVECEIDQESDRGRGKGPRASMVKPA